MRKGLMMILLAGLLTSISCSSKSDDAWTVKVTGRVGYPQSGLIVLQEIKDRGNNSMDTIHLKDDYTFEHTVTLSEPGYYRLNFYNRQTVDFILYKNDVDISVDGNGPSGFVKIKGSPELDFVQEVQNISRRAQMNPAIDKMNEEYMAAEKANDEAKMKAIREQYTALMKVADDSIAGLIEKEGPSLGVINLLEGGNVLDKDQYAYVYRDVADKLKKEWPNYSHAQNFIKMVDQMQALAIGQVAPEIALPNPDGTIVRLSTLRGKYVLVDFWAKWCGPCRRENPNLVAAYAKYKNRGFEIYGVSLDRTKEDWLQAIRQDSLTWTEVSDLKFWDSEAARSYNVNAIPFSLLLDPKGVIIAKNLRGPELDEKLAEIFGG